MGGAAYIRELYDRYGAPGFLAAYNAGPSRLDDYLGGGDPLPDEAVNYVAAIAPRLSASVRMTGPLAADAQAENGTRSTTSNIGQANARPVMSSPVGGACDPNAAYDPDRPCTPPPGWLMRRRSIKGAMLMRLIIRRVHAQGQQGMPVLQFRRPSHRSGARCIGR